ncbi:LacI family DNA-binding transcriptional regulator [Cerasicoccus arenae]|uniref:LacI family DNA-binding transcriptional regulator n=1 Tax=Cerasicoccus arenae TaxID=424488 RepID=UPI001E31AB38|nr:LacI family DNA-binding transcriptional regulator [Cerasicoccus arenae]
MTQKSIAMECGVSTATVSYALRNSARIPLKTRNRIAAVAKKLGYQPDPSLASLASRRSSKKGSPFSASVAVIHPNPKDSRPSRLFDLHCHHFKAKMNELGCSVTDFYIDSGRYRPERLAQILRTRGIKGILLGWGKWPDYIKRFPWSEFAVISTVRTDLGSSIDKVSMNHFHALDDVFQQLDNLPYNRYGVILHDDCPEITIKHILGAYYANHYERPSLKSLPPYCFNMGEPPERLAQWYQKHKPEVIISHRVIDPKIFARAGISVPDEVQLVVLEIDEESSIQYSGVYSGAEMGRTIAVSLARKIRSDEVYVGSRNGKLTFVSGTWREGETLRLPKKNSNE